MSGPTAAGPNAASGEAVPFARFVRYFLGLGTWGFGGPIATVGYMQRDLVEQRRWLQRQDFLNGVALGQTMPGPLAAQVVMWVGYLQGGALGALATSLTFILPSFVLVLAVAFLYVHPNEYRPDGSRTAREAWVRVPGKHRNRDAAWEALEEMIATRH